MLLAERFTTVSYLTKLLGQQYGFVRTKYLVNYRIERNGSSHVTVTEAFKAINEELPGVEHYTTIVTEPEHVRESFELSVDSKQAAPSGIEIIPKPTMVTPTKLYN